MVQRKVPNKLSIKADHIKPEKLLVNLKPPSLQNQEIKNRGPDLKKKMKKSGSRKQVELPGKPPPLVLPETASAAAVATPKKQSPSKLSSLETTPNYMKSTSSSAARKERAQVSYHSAQTSPASNRLSRRDITNLKSNSGPGSKPARTLSKISSLKLARTLTKTPSFKPSRASAKKHSPVILFDSPEAQNATCSSTMKDHKFPCYLTLSPGATEAEGPSVMKVCPYTYCSLNGHRHEPLPPLKCFLSVRRRTLKAQRSIKLGCLSPRRAKPVRDIMKEIEAAQMNIDEKLPPEDSWNSSSSSSMIQVESAGFFIEIYSKERVKESPNNQDTTDSSVVDTKPFIGVTGEMEAESEEADESPLNETISLIIDSNESLHQTEDGTFANMDADDYLAEENKNEKITEEVYPLDSIQVKTKTDFLNLMYELDAECMPIIPSEEADLEASDMDWEAGLYSASYPYDAAANPKQINHFIDLEKANFPFHDALLNEVVCRSDGTVYHCEGNLPDEIAQESMDDYFASEAGFGDKEAVKKPSLIGDDKEESQPEDVSSSMGQEVGSGISNIEITQYKDVKAQPMWNQEFEGCQEMGSREFAPKNSIGTQTDSEFEYPCNMSQDLDEVLIRSTGTQTDFEADQSDDLIDMSCFADKVRDRSMIVEKESIATSIPFFGIEHFMVSQDSGETMVHTTRAIHDESQLGAIINEGKQTQSLGNEVLEVLPDQVQECTYSTQSISSSNGLECSENENYGTRKRAEPISFENQTDTRMTGSSFAGNTDQNIQETEVDNAKAASITRIRGEPVGSNLNEEMTTWRIMKGKKRSTAEKKEQPEFNPRAPNFLPVEHDPEAEKVDLRHLMLDENKNTEEWMLDHALQRAVTKLAPARKRKVALLVEAFETVLPIPKHKTHLSLTSTVFPHVRPIQACS